MSLVLIAAAATALPPICTDRPTKANATCTVPTGHWQVETTLAGWSRLTDSGVRADTLALGSTTVKYGLGDHDDLQLAWTPFIRTTVKAAGFKAAVSGVGDTQVRLKHRLTAPDAPAQVAVIPFVKLPTARRGIGNRKVEGGLAVPVSFALGKSVTATLGPEVDLLADADGHGRHLGVVNLLNLAVAAAPRVTLVGELWSNLNVDPSGTVRQASADAALAYALSDRLQLDVGTNIGLNRSTADVELYAGLSRRF